MRNFSSLEIRADAFIKEAQGFYGLQQLSGPSDQALSKAVEESRPVRMLANMDQGARSGLDPRWYAARQELIRGQAPLATHVVTGTPFVNGEFLGQSAKPNAAVVELGGYGAGEKNVFGGVPLSATASSGSSVPHSSLLKYRYTDGPAANDAINLLQWAGVPTLVVGHSFGGDTAERLAEAHPETKVVGIDPVGRSAAGRDKNRRPPNFTVWKPQRRYSEDKLADLVALIGGPYAAADSDKRYLGGHLNGTENAFDQEFWSWVAARRRGQAAEKVKKTKTAPLDLRSPATRVLDMLGLGVNTAKPAGIEKSSSDYGFKDWANDVYHDFFKLSPPTRNEKLVSSLGGAAAGALLSYFNDKIRRRKVRKGRLLLSALAGAGAGTLSSYYRSYMRGEPFDNSAFSIDNISPGEKVYLGIAGAANGESTSWFGHDMRSRLPKGKVKMFRWGDEADLEKTYSDLVAKGAVPIIVGHSRGGRTAAKFLRNHPEAKGYLLDPVSWAGKAHPRNATAFTVDESTRHGGEIENYIADAGGRWNLSDAGTYFHTGTHSDRMPQIISDFIARGYDRDNVPEAMPDYITGHIYGRGDRG